MTTAEIEELIWKIDLMLSDTPDKLFLTEESRQMIFYNGFNLLIDIVLVAVAVFVTYRLTKANSHKAPFQATRPDQDLTSSEKSGTPFCQIHKLCSRSYLRNDLRNRGSFRGKMSDPYASILV